MTITVRVLINEKEKDVELSVPAHWDSCTKEQQEAYIEKQVTRMKGTVVGAVAEVEQPEDEIVDVNEDEDDDDDDTDLDITETDDEGNSI